MTAPAAARSIERPDSLVPLESLIVLQAFFGDSEQQPFVALQPDVFQNLVLRGDVTTC